MATAVDPPRYLVSFAAKRIAHRFTDVLVLGSGLAGMRAALAVDPPLCALILTKEKASQSNSSYAQGGIAAVWDPEDCFASHADDTLVAGAGLCDRAIVDLVVREAPRHVRELAEWGARFDQHDGAIALTREGGHSFSRIVHALGDATGKEVMRAVLDRARGRRNLQILEDTFILDLLTWEGRCVGALTWSPATGTQAVWSRQTVLATGGCGQLFRETTNPPVATGDGLAMAFRAGAQLQDMEFMQFHPTVLYVAGSSRFLISEAVRGEGAILRDRAGHRFMPEYDPRAELAPRDIVARAIVRQMARTQHPCVYLDQSHLDAAKVRARFPGIAAVCAQCGLDFTRDLIPVRPGAHYMVGGVTTDASGQTTLPGLWAAGEVAATGLHGANRLASNSLLEALVFGHYAGQGAVAAAGGLSDELRALPIDHVFDGRDLPGAASAPPTNVDPRSTAGLQTIPDAGALTRSDLDLTDIRNSLASLMFRSVGIERNRDGLESARANVDFWCQYVLGRELSGPAGWELQNLLTIAGLVIRAALARTESRGTHFREDFPAPNDDAWRSHLRVQCRPFAMTMGC